MLRYLRRLADKDVALDRSMIPLGSCTMKLNATSEMIPVTWREFAPHPPVRAARAGRGYREMIEDLEARLAQATGYAAVSIQPNAGSQGEYAGLLIIKQWHESRGEGHRNVCLIPSSAHGTNPASAQMVGHAGRGGGLRRRGQRRPRRPRAKAAEHAQDLAASWSPIRRRTACSRRHHEICEIVHRTAARSTSTAPT
jgi:glycine dehydrogenase